jgi:hypothetical protein
LWAVPDGRAERLALARAYPFAIPDHSLLFEDGGFRPLDDPEPHLAGRTAVLAVGSNQSPEQLARKFAHVAGTVIPVTRVWLDDFDVVYATHVTRYGSIPGNLHACPGARVRLSITWLDDAQLAVMHATEIAGENYCYARLDGVRIAIDGGTTLESVHAYVSRHGCLNHGGAAAGLAAIRAENRPHGALGQAEALALLAARAGHDGDLDDFIHEGIAEPELRAARTALMRRDALKFHWPLLTVVAR